MSIGSPNGVLCLGGPLDGRWVVAMRDLRHDEIVRVPVRALLGTEGRVPPSNDPRYLSPVSMPFANYRVWQWQDPQGDVFLLAEPSLTSTAILRMLMLNYRRS